MRLALALQAALLRLAPRAFRERFGAELLEVARRSLAEARRSGGVLAGLRAALQHSVDIAFSVLRLRMESPSVQTLLLFLLLALLVAAGIGWIDTHSEEVQPAVLLLFVAAGVLSFCDPRRAWLWWLVLGLSIPGTHFMQRMFDRDLPYEVSAFGWTFLALLPSGAGALLGFLLRLWTRPRWGLGRGTKAASRAMTWIARGDTALRPPGRRPGGGIR